MNRWSTTLLALWALSSCGAEQDAPAPTPEPEPEGAPPVMAAPPAPKAVVVVGKQDFGRIIQGDSPRVEYELRNDGDGSLMIERFKASCGCTDVVIEPRLIPPGEQCKINVTFKSEGRHGKQNRTVTLFTNDPAKPRIRLQVLAEIYRILNPEPEVLEFGHVLQGESGEASAVLSSSDGSPFTLTGIDCPDPNVAFEWTRIQEDPIQYRVDARLRATAPLGWTGGMTVWLEVEHERHTKIKLPMSGMVQLPVNIEPPRSLNVGQIVDGEPVEHTIHITNLRETSPLEPPDVSVISSVNRLMSREGGGFEELVQAQVHEVEAGQRYDVVVRVDDRIPQPQFVALVQLHLGGKNVRPHTIAVRGSKKMERSR